MLDAESAVLYSVSTKRLNEQVEAVEKPFFKILPRIISEGMMVASWLLEIPHDAALQGG